MNSIERFNRERFNFRWNWSLIILALTLSLTFAWFLTQIDHHEL